MFPCASLKIGQCLLVLNEILNGIPLSVSWKYRIFGDRFIPWQFCKKKKSFSFVIILSLRKRYYEKTALIICKYNYACLIVLFEENDILPVKLRRLWFLLQQIKIDWNNKIIIFNSIIFWQTNLKYPERYIFITP